MLELRRNSSGRFEVTNGISGTVQVIDPDIAKIRAQSRVVGTSFAIKKDPEPFQVLSGRNLGRTLIIASANGFSASLVVVVKPFGGRLTFTQASVTTILRAANGKKSCTIPIIPAKVIP